MTKPLRAIAMIALASQTADQNRFSSIEVSNFGAGTFADSSVFFRLDSIPHNQNKHILNLPGFVYSCDS